MSQQLTNGTIAPQNALTETQKEHYYANINNALINMTTLINSQAVYKEVSRSENGVTITIKVDLPEATK